MDTIYFSLQAKSHEKVVLSLMQMKKDFVDGFETHLPEVTIYTSGSFVFNGHVIDYDPNEEYGLCLLTYKNEKPQATYIGLNSVVSISINEVDKSISKLSLNNKVRSDSARPSNLEIKRHLKYYGQRLSKRLDKEVGIEADAKSFESAKEALALVEQLNEIKSASSRIKSDDLMLNAFKDAIEKIEIINTEESGIEKKGASLLLNLNSVKGQVAVHRAKAIVNALNDLL